MGNRATLDPDDPRHGTSTGYTYHRCRCPVCTEYRRVTHAAERDQRHARLDDPNYLQPTHGTVSTYCNWGCRCAPCIDARRIQSNNYQAALRTIRDLRRADRL